ncbi:MAG TPA: adenylate/guanylate cyclase domain-containing protein [Azospirillaceae bacterium]|nr:adenylate/guanylate cyclase domain-containing protein [Azospirillaceae bacterium]
MSVGYEIYGFKGHAWQLLGAMPGDRAEAENEARRFLKAAEIQGIRLVVDVVGNDGEMVPRIIFKKDKVGGLPPFRLRERGGKGVRRKASGVRAHKVRGAVPAERVGEPRSRPGSPWALGFGRKVRVKSARLGVRADRERWQFNFWPGFSGFFADLFRSIVEPFTVEEDGSSERVRAAAAAAKQAERSVLVDPKIEDEDFRVDAARKEIVRHDTEVLLRYLYSNLRFVQAKTPYTQNGRLTPTDAFACYLFFAGAAEAHARKENRPANEFRRAVATCLANIAKSDEEARKFALHYEEYLADPIQAKVFLAGSDGFNTWTRGASSFERLALALKDWREAGTGATVGPQAGAPTDGAPAPGTGGPQPGGNAANDQVIAVMFTDIVGSTEHSQTYGDELHMQLIGMHDQTVRAALNAHNGVEIKHLGDGIMASFATIQDAVKAGQRIQAEVARMDVPDPRLALTLRVGLNAGKPVRMGSDLFGSTVQLAARVCSVCPPGQVAASESVVVRAEGSAALFRPLGNMALKGFPEPVPIFAAPGGP